MDIYAAQAPPLLRKPDWLKVRLPGSPESEKVKSILAQKRLHSICQEARCPNMGECFQEGTAAFLIMGNICTRHCLYCNVRHGQPLAVDVFEADRLVEAVDALQLKYVVITSVTRDDLADGGASVFVHCIEELRRKAPYCRIEILLPDFQGTMRRCSRS